MKETWKPIKKFEQTHWVSNIGRVKSRNKLLTTRVNPRRRITVNLWDGRRNHFRYVHRLVALAFIGDCPIGHEVNHKDGNPMNNCVDNLEWVTRHENMKHAYATGLRTNEGEAHPRAKLTEEEVLQIRRLRQNNRKKWKLTVLAEKFEVSREVISAITNGHTWKHLTNYRKSTE